MCGVDRNINMRETKRETVLCDSIVSAIAVHRIMCPLTDPSGALFSQRRNGEREQKNKNIIVKIYYQNIYLMYTISAYVCVCAKQSRKCWSCLHWLFVRNPLANVEREAFLSWGSNYQRLVFDSHIHFSLRLLCAPFKANKRIAALNSRACWVHAQPSHLLIATYLSIRMWTLYLLLLHICCISAVVQWMLLNNMAEPKHNTDYLRHRFKAKIANGYCGCGFGCGCHPLLKIFRFTMNALCMCVAMYTCL